MHAEVLTAKTPTRPVNDELEARLGVASDPDNPFGHRAVVAADEGGETLHAAEQLLDDYCLNAEFVPTWLGGRFSQADQLVLTLRPLFRRDPVLGLGYGMASFIGAAPIWTSGRTDQHRWLADLLLSNQRVAAGYTELAHGGDFSRAELRATPASPGYLLSGTKQLTSNAARARAITLFARTDDAPGSRSHSHLLVDAAVLPADAVRRTMRFPTSGMRALLLGGLEFRDCWVHADSVVGRVGEALETVLRAFQVTRTVLPAMAIGVLDTQLRLVGEFAATRRLYGRTLADLPAVRSMLVDAFVDLLTCDSLATVGARALHVLPEQTSVYAAAVKYLVPSLVRDANYALSTVLGARSYLREGPYALFQKNSRDLVVASLAHASAAACQTTIIPQLTQLARRSWRRAEAPPGSLWRLGEPLPGLHFSRLQMSAKGGDNITAILAHARDDRDLMTSDPELSILVDFFVAELGRLQKSCLALSPRDRTVVAGPHSFALADRYATVLAASGCLGVWWHQPEDGDEFLRDPAWVVAALRRLASRLGRAQRSDVADRDPAIYAELRRRLDAGLAFDLTGSQLAG